MFEYSYGSLYRFRHICEYHDIEDLLCGPCASEIEAHMRGSKYLHSDNTQRVLKELRTLIDANIQDHEGQTHLR